MKKTLVALSVATFVASTANAVTVYNNNGTQLDVSGSARVMLTKEKNQRVDLQNDGSRIKFKFSQQISDGFSALGFMELRPSDNTFGNGITTKYLYAGLQADGIGSLTFGRQKTAGDNFKLADPAEQDLAINDAMGIITEAQKVITLKTADFYGFGLEASYIFDEDAEKFDPNTDTAYPNQNKYQIMARYENTFGEFGLKAHALYAHKKYQADGSENLPESLGKVISYFPTELYGLSAAFTYADFGLAVDYVRTKIKDNRRQDLEIGGVEGIGGLLKDYRKANGVQVALTYQVFEPMDIYAIYHHYTYEGVIRPLISIAGSKDKGTTKVSLNGFGVGTHYYLNKNIMTYIEYNRDKVSGVDSTNNAAYVGLRVFF